MMNGKKGTLVYYTTGKKIPMTHNPYVFLHLQEKLPAYLKYDNLLN